MLKIKNFSFEVKMDTDGGTASFIHEAKLVKDKDAWKVDWTPDFIFPYEKDYKVRMQTEDGKRGEIYTIEMGKVLQRMVKRLRLELFQRN